MQRRLATVLALVLVAGCSGGGGSLPARRRRCSKRLPTAPIGSFPEKRMRAIASRL